MIKRFGAGDVGDDLPNIEFWGLSSAAEGNDLRVEVVGDDPEKVLVGKCRGALSLAGIERPSHGERAKVSILIPRLILQPVVLGPPRMIRVLEDLHEVGPDASFHLPMMENAAISTARELSLVAVYLSASGCSSIEPVSEGSVDALVERRVLE